MPLKGMTNILNKLTPEKFDKLCQEILNIGIDSKVIIKGIVILIYEKAIDELRYSSLYANLCRRLYHEAPNFDSAQAIGPSTPKPNTFRRLLIAKLQDEFENRNKKLEAFDAKDGPLTIEEEEQRALAKHHMLGNIKFIGELYRLSILQENIVHKCIKQLINKKKKGTVDDLSEDLECLCQIMTTCGRRLDHEKAKSLMDQYFDRLNHLHKKKTELPTRIRFMLQDVMDLRTNNWVPRSVKVSLNQGPKTLSQIRAELVVDFPNLLVDTKSPSIHNNFTQAKLHKDQNQYFPSASGLGFFPMTKKQQYNGLGAPLSSPLPAANEREPSGPGPGFDFFSSPSSHNRPNFNPTSNGEISRTSFTSQSYPHSQRNERCVAPMRFTKPFPQPNYSMTYNGRYADSSPSYRLPASNSVYSRVQPPFIPQNVADGLSNTQNQGKKIRQQYIGRTSSPPSGEKEVQQELTDPVSYSSSKPNGTRANTKSPLPQKTTISSAPASSPRRQLPTFRGTLSNNKTKPKPSSTTTANTFQPPFQHVLDNAKKPSNRKSANSSQVGQKSKKSMSEKEVIEFTEKTIGDFFSESFKVNQISSQIKHANIHKKYMPLVCETFLKKSLFGSDDHRSMACKALIALCEDDVISKDQVDQGLRAMLKKLTSLENELPRLMSVTASLLAYAVTFELLALELVGERLAGGYHFPLFLLTLQKIVKIKGKEGMLSTFTGSKIDMKTMMPEVSRSNKNMLEILSGKQLSFLLPLLKMEAELNSQLDANPSPNVVYRWIRENVDAELHTDVDFINILMTCCLNYITKNCSLAEGIDRTQSASKQIQEKEKNLLCEIKPLLQKFIHDKPNLQLHALYAVQVFCYSADFPKGLMLRLFNLLYNEDVLDEETFISWKEDFNDKYPGKGKSLFQVNSWLTWLEEADTEEDEEEA